MIELPRIETPIILSLDTTQSILYLSLHRGVEAIASIADDSGLPHSQRLFLLLDELLKNQSLTIQDIDLLAVNVGPGSFTGLRVGIAAVKGLAATLGKPALGVNAFDALACAAGVPEMPVVALIQAAKAEVYCGLRWMERDGSIRSLQVDCVKSIGALLPELRKQLDASDAIFIGNGAEAHWAELQAVTPRWMLTQPANLLAAAIAATALQRLRSGQLSVCDAYYIRPSEAENKLRK
jgi:tRNA threonylcarbamoyladenosine biosynthesis protein TsaB